MACLRHAAISRSPFSFEAKIRTALGTSKWIRVVGDVPRPNLMRGFITDCSVVRSSTDVLPEIERRVLEAEREDAEVRHRELFEGVPLPVISYDWHSRRILDVNKQAAEHYGYSKDEFLGMLISDLWPKDQARASDLRLMKMDPIKPSHIEERHVRKDGSVIEVDVSSHVIPLQQRPVRVLVIRDVTERNRYERDLQVSNDRLRSLTRVTGAVLGSLPLSAQAQLMAEQVREAFNVDACVVRVTKGESLHLLASAGIESDQLLEIVPWNEGLPSRLLAERGPFAIEDMRRAKDIPPYDPSHYSAYSFVSYAGAPLTVKERMIGVIAIFMHDKARMFTDDDLTHLQIVANNVAVAVLNHELYQQLSDHRTTLESSEERLRQVTEASSDAIWEWDRASDTVTWTERVYELLGLSPTAISTQRKQALEVIHPDERGAFFTELIRHARKRGPFRREVRLCQGDGSFGTYEAFGKMVYGKDNRPVRMVGSIHDISDRVRRDRELEAVAAISLALREIETTEEMLPVISEQIARTLELQSLGVALVDPDSDDVLIRHVSGVFRGVLGLRFRKHDGFVERVFGVKKERLAEDMTASFDSMLADALDTPTAVLGVPLVARGEVIGMLWLGKPVDGAKPDSTFSQGESRLLGILAEIAAASLRRAALRERTEFHLRRLHSLSVVHATVSENLDLRTTLDMLIQQLRSQTGIHAAAFHLFDEKSGLFRLETSYGFGVGIVVPPLGRDLILNRHRSKLTDLQESGARGRRFATMIAAGFESYLAVPLIANENILGVLEIYHKTDLPQNVDLDNFAEMLASQAAVAVDNTNLLKSLRTANRELTAAYDATIEGWARALDLRDHETEGHTRRVTEMTVDLAKLMDVPPNEIAHMRRGALLHDIGKMAIPDRVLLKAGELDQSEWVVMRRHPGIALDLLEPISFLKPAIDIPFCHHEKWDGTGYPRGLKGKQIPLSARIFAVIDVWDALRSDRPYRKGWSREQAVHFIRVQAGRHFDPEITEVFLNNLASIDRWIR
jgi:PAS domain S-box-containing protein